MLARFARWLFLRTHRRALDKAYVVASIKQPNERQYLLGRKHGAAYVLEALGL